MFLIIKIGTCFLLGTYLYFIVLWILYNIKILLILATIYFVKYYYEHIFYYKFNKLQFDLNVLTSGQKSYVIDRIFRFLFFENLGKFMSA